MTSHLCIVLLKCHLQSTICFSLLLTGEQQVVNLCTDFHAVDSLRKPSKSSYLRSLQSLVLNTTVIFSRFSCRQASTMSLPVFKSTLPTL
uniref:Putative secreted protein n=1 Tax=Amblyomma cajennense TaxID=34607 RepID=A0A023FD92_AMBCJ